MVRSRLRFGLGPVWLRTLNWRTRSVQIAGIGRAAGRAWGDAASRAAHVALARCAEPARLVHFAPGRRFTC